MFELFSVFELVRAILEAMSQKFKTRIPSLKVSCPISKQSSLNRGGRVFFRFLLCACMCVDKLNAIADSVLKHTRHNGETSIDSLGRSRKKLCR